MRFSIILLTVLGLSSSLNAQELNAAVQVLSPNVQTSNKEIFTTMETAMREFLNNRRWTEKNYAIEERIRCQFVVNIEERNNNSYTASLQIFYSRPIYNSDYNSPVLVHRDPDFDFKYLEFDRLDFAENTFTSNLTSVLAFYAYIIIGMDADTYAPMSGTPYYQKAQNIVGNAQNNGFTGWDSFGNNKNRYWLVDNLTTPAFDNFRSCLYLYHRQGLDLMHDNAKVPTAKKNIKNGLIGLEKVNDQRRNSFIMQLWFDAKQKEIVQIFSGGAPLAVADLKQTLIKLDPNNSSSYEKIGQG